MMLIDVSHTYICNWDCAFIVVNSTLKFARMTEQSLQTQMTKFKQFLSKIRILQTYINQLQI